MTPAAGTSSDDRSEYASELRGYLIGYGVAILLTLVPFGLVNWHGLAHFGLYVTIGTCALAQIIIHFRFFLHINPPRQNVHDLQLILFSGLLVFFMVAGTLWIMASLAARLR